MSKYRTVITLKIESQSNSDSKENLEKAIREAVYRILINSSEFRANAEITIEKCKTYNLTNTQLFMEEVAAWEDD